MRVGQFDRGCGRLQISKSGVPLQPVGTPPWILPSRGRDLVLVVFEADLQLTDRFVDGADGIDAVTAEVMRRMLQIVLGGT